MTASHCFAGLVPAELAALVDKLSGAFVAVLGDFCLDAYWTYDRDFTVQSIETGLPTEPVRVQKYAPGGAGNVVMNLLALGAHEIHPIGVLGNDPFGRELDRLLEHPKVQKLGLLTQPEDWATHTYIKAHVNGTELNRVDTGNFNSLSATSRSLLLSRLEGILPKVSVVLINHQVAGSLHDDPIFRKRLAEIIKSHPQICFVVDSRGYHDAYPSAVHKMNEREVMLAAGAEITTGDGISLSELSAKAQILQSRFRAPLIITRGERGCLICDGDITYQIFGVQLLGRVDPVGAGDTFVATLAASVATGANLCAAAYLANVAAAVTAQKLFQTGAASPKEIFELGLLANFTYRPELADCLGNAQYFEDTEIEIIVNPRKDLDIQHAIFDHDGTISTLREGWEQIMEPMMIRCVLGPDLGAHNETIYLNVRNRIRQFINVTTGIQTIIQMQGLVDIVREFGLIPQAEILDAAGYKEIYNRELKALIQLRLDKLDRGELSVGDFTLKGSVSFLERLHRAGVRLYLASGTDDEDVKFEAERLGYASLFSGGIFGSVGNTAEDAKKMVLQRIIDTIRGTSGTVAAFGDGPVEMRETVKCGGWAVGLASDEMRRFGSNPDKRARLIRAGAHIIAPDFSQPEALWRLLCFR